jgi:hypothetical protein
MLYINKNKGSCPDGHSQFPHSVTIHADVLQRKNPSAETQVSAAALTGKTGTDSKNKGAAKGEVPI